jgi:hypothetical protein
MGVLVIDFPDTMKRWSVGGDVGRDFPETHGVIDLSIA